MAPVGSQTITYTDDLVEAALSKPQSVTMHRQGPVAGLLAQQRAAKHSAKRQRHAQRPAWRR